MKTLTLCHLGLSTDTHNFKTLFGDVKFVCCGGLPKRMYKLAHYLINELAIPLPIGTDLVDMCISDHYAMYKVGPVLCVSHGIGVVSMSTVVNEVMVILNHAGCGKSVEFFRLGTCGGLGSEGGTVIVSKGVVNGVLEPVLECFVMGQRTKHQATLDENMSNTIYNLSKEFDFPVIQGITMTTDDFYEGQARLDGAFCSYSENEKLNFFHKCHELGVRNIEMEAAGFASLVHRAGYKGAVVCVALLNRLKEDQVVGTTESLKAWEERPCKLIARYIKQRLT